MQLPRKAMSFWLMPIANSTIFLLRDCVSLLYMGQQADQIWRILVLPTSCCQVRKFKFLTMAIVSVILHMWMILFMASIWLWNMLRRSRTGRMGYHCHHMLYITLATIIQKICWNLWIFCRKN